MFQHIYNFCEVLIDICLFVQVDHIELFIACSCDKADVQNIDLQLCCLKLGFSIENITLHYIMSST